MNMSSMTRPVLASLLMALPLSAGATVLEPLKGEILVSRGNGFKPVHGLTELNPGDLVMASPGGAATVRFSASCSWPVQVGAVVVVTKTSPCAPTAQTSSVAKGLTTGSVVAGARPPALEGRMRLNPEDPQNEPINQSEPGQVSQSAANSGQGSSGGSGEGTGPSNGSGGSGGAGGGGASGGAAGSGGGAGLGGSTVANFAIAAGVVGAGIGLGIFVSQQSASP